MGTHHLRALLISTLLAILLAACSHRPEVEPVPTEAPPPAAPWRGVHFLSTGHAGLPQLRRAIEEVLVPLGVNVIILEVGYGYDYTSHPELAAPDPLTRDDVRGLVALCRAHDIRLVPQFNCLGHQSWAKTTFPLLEKYPQFDETPDIPRDNPDIYCRSWCPQHPDVNPIIFALMDELIDAFEADAFHVGMDEVFLIASDQCPRCKGSDPARLFAKAVNDYHEHLVKGRGVEMMMWGDRLIDTKSMPYSEWEASANGTAPAIDLIPRDIVICDWHYGKLDAYPSVEFFQEKGFRVWPSSWNEKEASLAFLRHADRVDTGGVVGHLCTTWMGGEVPAALLGEGTDKLNKNSLGMAESLRAVLGEMQAVGNIDEPHFTKSE